MYPSFQPIRLTIGQKEPAARLLAKAFQDDPMMVFIEPEEGKRSIFLSWLMGTVANYCILYGEAYTTPDLEGVAGWLPPGYTTPTFWRMLRTGMLVLRLKLGSAASRRFLANMIYTEKVHRQAMPEAHWYLWSIGVEPTRQGQGIGGGLLRPVLGKASKDNLSCYLETHNSRNLDFYQKFGFEVVSDGVVPKRGLRVWAMIRKP